MRPERPIWNPASCAIPKLPEAAKKHTKERSAQRRKECRKRRLLQKGVIKSDLGFEKMLLAVSEEWV